MNRRKCQIKGIALALVLAAAMSAGGCSKKTEETQQLQATKVQTLPAQKGDLEITGTYVGTVKPHTSVNVTPMVAGTVKKVHVKAGDRVEEGDVLCEFDDKAAQLSLESAKNALESAKAGKEAAQDQIDAAKKQADANIDSLKSQLKALKKQRKASKKQLKELKAGLKDLKKANKAAAKGYQTVKAMYDSANALYIQYQAFLSENPDCATMAGLMAAAAALPEQVVSAPAETELTDEILESGDEAETGADLTQEELVRLAQEQLDGLTEEQLASLTPEQQQALEAVRKASQEAVQEAGTAVSEAAAAQAAIRQQTAAALLEALGKIPLTVEYLTPAGLDTLKDQMSQAQTAATAASSGYAEAVTGKKTLESGISSMNDQIKTLQKSIKTAEDAADQKTSTKAYDTQIKAAKTGVESAQYQKDLYTVKAPAGGVIESVNVRENEIAAQGYPAFTIADKQAVEVSFYVPQEVRDFLQPGSEVQVEGPSGTVSGKITTIASAVDPQKGLFLVEAEVTSEQAKTFLSGTSATISLVTNAVRGQILIPFDALYYDNDQAYVFIEEGGKALRRDVTAGPYNNEKITILGGLTGGEQVITTWGAGLKDGAAVEVIEQK